jgi:hypothetical protein
MDTSVIVAVIILVWFGLVLAAFEIRRRIMVVRKRAEKAAAVAEAEANRERLITGHDLPSVIVSMKDKTDGN